MVSPPGVLKEMSVRGWQSPRREHTVEEETGEDADEDRPMKMTWRMKDKCTCQKRCMVDLH